MIKYINTAKFVFTLNGYSISVHGVRYTSLLRGKFENYGRVMLSANISQVSQFEDIRLRYKLKDFNSIMQDVPKKLRGRTTDFNVTYGFTIHEETAKDIADVVMDSVLSQKKEPVVIELNPGLGLITKHLFKRGLNNLIVYDINNFKQFKDILNEYGSKIKLYNLNGLETKYEYNHFATPCIRFFHDLSEIEDKKIVIVGMCPNRLVFRRMIGFLTKISFSSFRNTEFYFTLGNTTYNCLMSFEDKNAHTNDYGCFQILFDISILKKYPRYYFLPLPMEANSTISFVKLTRKADILTKDDLALYINFLKIIGSKKRNYILGELEKWFPGSGIYFIAKGISATNQVSELSPVEFIRLFKILTNIKGYDDSFSLMKDYDSFNVMELKPKD